MGPIVGTGTSQYDACVMACSACGFEADVQFAFCPKCGQRLAAPPAQAESDRRPVTVMFADLSGFTSLSESLDPEVVRSLQTELFAEMSAAIQRLDGFVEKYVGDAVMAVFGAPVAHDQDPERAVSAAAILLHEKIAALSERWIARIGRPLALHIGINTGPVVAGHIGSNPEATYAVTGDTVNAAARLQSAAEFGQTFVSRSTYVLTQHAFEFEELGPLPVKGKAEPMAAFRLVAARSAPQAVALASRPTALRHHLLGGTRNCMCSCKPSRPCVAGRANWFASSPRRAQARAGFFRNFSNNCARERRLPASPCEMPPARRWGSAPMACRLRCCATPYGLSAQEPVAEAQRKIDAALADIGLEEQERQQTTAYLAFVLALEADDARTRYLDPEQLKRQIFSAVLGVIRRRLQRGPVMLIVEDLHWADTASLDVLRYLLDQLGGQAFMLLVTHRPTPEAASLASDAAAHTMVALEPLSPQCSAKMLDELFRICTANVAGRIARTHRRARRRQPALSRRDGACPHRRWRVAAAERCVGLSSARFGGAGATDDSWAAARVGSTACPWLCGRPCARRR